MSDYILQTQNISKSFGQKWALQDFSMAIPAGGVHAVVGRNGAGKTTLFKLLLGFYEPDYGVAEVLGVNSQYLQPQHRARIAFVNDEHSLPDWLTVDQVAEQQRCLYSDWSDEIYQEVLSNFSVSTKQKVNQLSRGERAGLNLALSFAQQPELLVLDEPTLGLDPVAKQEILECLLFTEAKNNSTIIYCSHQLEEVERVADNIIFIDEGCFDMMTTPDQFMERFSHWVVETQSTAPQATDVPGLLRVRKIEDAYHYVILDAANSFESFINSTNPVSVKQIPIGLRKAVIEYLSRTNRIAS